MTARTELNIMDRYKIKLSMPCFSELYVKEVHSPLNPLSIFTFTTREHMGICFRKDEGEQLMKIVLRSYPNFEVSLVPAAFTTN